MAGTFAALRTRNYRLFFIGQTLSLIGTWMQSVAMQWLVYSLTGSAWWLGFVTFSSQIPMFLVSPLAGVTTDRLDRRKLLVLTQSLQAAQALALAVLVFSGRARLWEILALSVFVGIVNAFDTPGRQAFVIEIVQDRRLLPNAIALNSTQFNIARLIGPAVAGLAIRAVGTGACFLINAVSFLAVIFGLLLMQVAERPNLADATKPLQDLAEGWNYVRANGPIRAMLVLLAVISFVSGAYQVLLPIVATRTYHGDSGTLGYMYAAVGVGALIAALMLASRRSVLGLGGWIVGASALFSVSMALFGLSNSFWIGSPMLLGMGFGLMKHMGSTNTLIQTLVDDRVRGRVMAFYAMSFVGTMPLGSLVTGAVSPLIGPPRTMLVGGVIGLAASRLFLRLLPRLREQVMPVYREKGIIAPLYPEAQRPESPAGTEEPSG